MLYVINYYSLVHESLYLDTYGTKKYKNKNYPIIYSKPSYMYI